MTYKYHEKRFSLGKATSRAPIWIGMIRLPKAAGMPGMMNRKIMITPCRVNVALYVWASMMVSPGANSSKRISKPRITPTMKKATIHQKYINPMRLWSVDKSQRKIPE